VSPRANGCAIIGPNGAGKTTFFNLHLDCPADFGRISFATAANQPHLSTLNASRSNGPAFSITEILSELTVVRKRRISADVPAEYRPAAVIRRAERPKSLATSNATLKLCALTKTDRLVGELAHATQRADEIADGAGVKAASLAGFDERPRGWSPGNSTNHPN